MIHDSEYYILEAQHGARWSVEDKDLDQKLVELRQKFGTPPNIIHIMFDDTPVGEVGISFIQKQRGWETPERVPARQAGKSAREWFPVFQLVAGAAGPELYAMKWRNYKLHFNLTGAPVRFSAEARRPPPDRLIRQPA